MVSLILGKPCISQDLWAYTKEINLEITGSGYQPCCKRASNADGVCCAGRARQGAAGVFPGFCNDPTIYHWWFVGNKGV